MQIPVDAARQAPQTQHQPVHAKPGTESTKRWRGVETVADQPIIGIFTPHFFEFWIARSYPASVCRMRPSPGS